MIVVIYGGRTAGVNRHARRRTQLRRETAYLYVPAQRRWPGHGEPSHNRHRASRGGWCKSCSTPSMGRTASHRRGETSCEETRKPKWASFICRPPSRWWRSLSRATNVEGAYMVRVARLAYEWPPRRRRSAWDSCYTGAFRHKVRVAYLGWGPKGARAVWHLKWKRNVCFHRIFKRAFSAFPKPDFFANMTPETWTPWAKADTFALSASLTAAKAMLERWLRRDDRREMNEERRAKRDEWGGMNERNTIFVH